MKMQREQGFTLIELIVVIVILGILAATALPKFVSVGADARAGVMKGVMGSMMAANTMVYGKAAAQGKANAASGQTLSTNGQTVSLVYGYASNATELAKVLDLNPTADFTVATGSISHARAATPANCSITYAAPTGVGLQPTYTRLVDGDTGGDCS